MNGESGTSINSSIVSKSPEKHDDNEKASLPVVADPPKVAGQAILLALSTVTGQMLLAIALVLAARWSTPAELGTVITAMSLGAVINGLADFGSTTLWVREIASGRMSPNHLRNLMISKAVILLAILTPITIAAYFVLPQNAGYWTSGVLAYVVMLNQMIQIPLRGNARGDLAAIVVFVDRLSVFLVFIGANLIIREPIDALIVGLVVGPLVAACAARCITPQQSRGNRGTFTVTNPWRGTRHFGFTNIVLSAQQLDVPILTWVGGASATGIYGAVSKWTQPMTIISSAFTSAAAPFLARSPNWRDMLIRVRPSLWIPALGCMVACLLAIFSQPLVDIILGPNYETAGSVLFILALSAIPGILNTCLLTLFQYTGKERSAFWVVWAAVPCQLVLTMLLGGTHGALGAAVALAANQTLQSTLFVLLLFLKRKTILRATKSI